MSEEIALESLVGEHELSGVSFDDIPPNSGEFSRDYDISSRCTFVLDGQAYQAIEDPSDGYRSELGHLLPCDAALVLNRFDPIKVLGAMRGNQEYQTDDVLEFRDLRNGKVILAVGTENTNDYYPCYVANWTPENIALSKTD